MHLLIKYIQSTNASKYEIAQSLRLELKSACDFHAYDYSELNKVFPIEDLVNFAKATSKSSEVNNLFVNPPVFYYEWNGFDHDLDALSRDMKSENIIQGIKNFKELFGPHNGEIQVKFNKLKFDFIIVLFDCLYHMGLLVPRGKNCGKFHPLQLYDDEFNNNFLIEKEPKQIKYRIKKRSGYYQDLLNKASRWTKEYRRK